MAEFSAPSPRRRFLLECSGACGDLGTFIPHVIGAITVAGLAPTGVLFGFAAFLISTGLFYGLPLPVQPMKAISAVILTGGLRPGEVLPPVMIGIVLLILGITGWIGRLARAIPQSVSAGLQLGLGLSMSVLGLTLILAEDGHYNPNPRLSVTEDPSDAPPNTGAEDAAAATGNA